MYARVHLHKHVHACLHLQLIIHVSSVSYIKANGSLTHNQDTHVYL